MQILDLDEITTWAPWFDQVMTEIAGEAMVAEATRCSPEYVEDARDYFVERIGAPELTSSLSRRLKSFQVRVYHGTRLTDDETKSVVRSGLRPLVLADRRSALRSIFARHPRWPMVEGELDAILQRLGPNWETGGCGRREDNAVHVCLSRAGLVRGCNHYLQTGAEVDDVVARLLFGDETSLPLLKAARQPKLISFCAPWLEAVEAASPRGLRDTELPSLSDEFLKAWAFRLSHPEHDPATQRISVAAMFKGAVAPSRLTIEDLADSDLE